MTMMNAHAAPSTYGRNRLLRCPGPCAFAGRGIWTSLRICQCGRPLVRFTAAPAPRAPSALESTR